MKTFKIEGVLADKYEGCGAARARIQLRFEGGRRFLDKLVDFEYLEPRSSNMSPDAGKLEGYENCSGIAIKSDPENFEDEFKNIEGGVFARVIVNMSCYEACLG